MERPPQERERTKLEPDELLGKLEGFDFPVAKDSKSLRTAFRTNNRLILEAETGSGKTTIAPGFFIAELLKDNPDAKMLVTQPSRVSTKALSEYVGSEIVGDEFVDYRYRDHQVRKPDTRIEFTVEGSLLKMMEKDPKLKGYDAVMVDEVDGASDLVLSRIKNLQKLRDEAGMKQLKLVLASGTLDAPKLKQYFENDGLGDMPLHHIEGRAHEVAPIFAPNKVPQEAIPAVAARAAADLFAMPEKTGDLLIFMPGEAVIDQTIVMLDKRFAELGEQNVEVIKIMGGNKMDPYAEINRNTDKRRIYVATNVAETSITIPKITMVIDSGLEKKMIYNPDTRTSSLEVREHTQANWDQRKGRAGRTQPGEAYALFTEAEFKARPKHQVADILHTDLAPLILTMKAIGIEDVHNYDYYDRPEEKKIDIAVETLAQLGALDENGKITAVGQEMAEMEEDDPHYARMLVEANKRGCREAVALLIGAMKTKEWVFDYNTKDRNFKEKYSDYIDPDSDFITYLNIWNDYIKNRAEEGEWAKKGFKLESLYSASREKRNLVNGSDSAIDLTPEQIKAIRLSVAAGLGDQLVVHENIYKFVDGRPVSGISIDSMSALANKKPDAFVTGKIKSGRGKRGGMYLSMNQRIDRKELSEVFKYLNLPPEPVEKPKPEIATAEVAPETQKSPEPAKKHDQPQVNADEARVQEEIQKVDENPAPKETKEIENVYQRIKNSIKNFSEKIKELLRKLGKKLGLSS